MEKLLNLSYCLFFCSLMLSVPGCSRAPRYKEASLPVEERINDLISRMTLEEKAAQLDMLAANDVLENDTTLSSVKLHYYIDSLCIGAIHDFYPKTAALANELQKRAIENSRLGIPVIFIEEALHGYQGRGATAFPVPLGNASTWDTTLMHQIGRVVATEARAHGVHFILGPNLDLAREIRWGRTEETFGEDTYLSSRMAVNLVKGLQGDSLSDPDAVVAEPKHFAMHGIPEGGSNEGPVMIGERDARSSYLYVFEKAVREGKAKGIMAAYHETDGIPSVANKWLLTTVLREEWGFDGFTVSDLGAIRRQKTNHHTVETDEKAIIKALSAGLDMQFYDFKYEDFQKAIVESVKNGSIKNEDLDRAVKGVLRVKFMLGLFDHPYTDTTLSDEVFHSSGHQALALEAAQKSIILLKNENHTLPLRKDLKRITLAGNLTTSTYTGGYSPAGSKAISVYEALQKRFGGEIAIDLVSSGISDRFSSISPENMSPKPGSDIKSLTVEFFNNATLEGKPVYTGFDSDLNPFWHNLSPEPGISPERFSARWSGYLTAPVTGSYEFSFHADDMGRIFIDNHLFINNWDEVLGNKETLATIRLRAGQTIPFCVEFAKTKGNAGMNLKWRLADSGSSSLFDRITQSSATSDVTIVVLGETNEEVGESRDRQNLYPHAFDMEVLKAATKSGKPVITVMLTGRPLILTEIAERCPALLQTWFPGEATGDAIIDVLFGNYNPSGKLTISFPKTQGQLPIYYSKKPSSHRRYVDGDGVPLFPFGHGLSYSTFEYGPLTVTPEHPKTTDNITVSLDITNTGKVDGTEVVQLYLNDVVSSVAVPEIALKGFSNISLKAGETRKVSMVLTPEHLSLLNIDMKRVVEPGDFNIFVGSSSSDIRQKQAIKIKN